MFTDERESLAFLYNTSLLVIRSTDVWSIVKLDQWMEKVSTTCQPDCAAPESPVWKIKGFTHECWALSKVSPLS